VAAKEWRNRWLLFITLLFALMALGLSWFGAVATGQLGTAPLPTLIVSLAVLVIPLIALLIALLIGILVLWVTTSLTLTTWRFNSKTL
jgi:hypothetical protein